MNKRALKRKDPNRHMIIKLLKKENFIKNVIDKRGNPVALNLMKHFLNKEPYTNQEYNREMLRFIQSNRNLLPEVKEEVKEGVKEGVKNA